MMLNSIPRGTGEAGFNRRSLAQTVSMLSLNSPRWLRNSNWLTQARPRAIVRVPPTAIDQLDTPRQPHDVTVRHQTSGCNTLSDPVFVNDLFDFVDASHAADLNLNTRLSSRGDTNSSNA